MSVFCLWTSVLSGSQHQSPLLSRVHDLQAVAGAVRQSEKAWRARNLDPGRLKLNPKPILIPTRDQLRLALLDAFLRMGIGMKLPLLALVTLTMQNLRTKDHEFMVHFRMIHAYLRTQWGNQGMFSRRRGLQGGISLRPKIQKTIRRT